MFKNNWIYGRHLISLLIALALSGVVAWKALPCHFFYGATSITLNCHHNDNVDVKELVNWRQKQLSWQILPIDLSFLNDQEKPAGRRGFVKAFGESLIFQDGVQARFWGANLSANALFGTTKDNVKLQARRLSALGFNLVRLHHMDSSWVNPNIFNNTDADIQILNASSLEKLDWWIKCLKDEGIYIWLDLHVGRRLSEGDHIYGFDEIRKSKSSASMKGYNYVNQTIQEAMRRFNESLLSHINSHTGVAYKDEPAIMTMLLTNENDITQHLGNALLPDKKVPLHTHKYLKFAQEFAEHNGLTAKETWRSWVPGPSKIFLNDLEYQFNKVMISHLRNLGVKVPIVTTSTWDGNPLYSLPALTAGDIIDVHAYGGEHELDKDPFIESNMVNWLSIGQVSGKPMSVSEWNVSPFPVTDRHSIPLYLASAARLQGWDAVMLYAYAQVPLNEAGKASNWDAFNDPSLIATLPAAALLYRQGHIKEANTIYALTPDKNQMFYQATSADSSAPARIASEMGKLVVVMPQIPELNWLKKGEIPSGAKGIKNINQTLQSGDVIEVQSDTGEIKRNWFKGVYTINTPRTQAAMGKIGNRDIVLSDIQIDISAPNASVVVQSMDGASIRHSSRMMISLGYNSIPAEDKQSFHSKHVSGKLIIYARKGLKLFTSTEHEIEKEISVSYVDGKYFIDLAVFNGASWLILQKTK